MTKRDTPKRKAHRIVEQLIEGWLGRGEPEDSCGCDGCSKCTALREALDGLAQQHHERGAYDG